MKQANQANHCLNSWTGLTLEFSTRSQILIMECVAALLKDCSVVSEKGTAVVSKLRAERGFVGLWKIVNTDNGDD